MRYHKASFYPVIVLFFITVCFGCGSPSSKAPDVSNISMQVDIKTFHRDFFSIDTSHVRQGLADLYRKYPTFLPVYLEHILNYGPYSDTSLVLQKGVRGLLTTPDVRKLQEAVNKQFPDLESLQDQLKQGFRYIKYYFPGFHPPRVVTFISGLGNYGAVTADTVLGIGLDMFMGRDFPLYTQLADPYPEYLLQQFSPEYIAADCFKVIEQQMFPLHTDKQTLLTQMVERGKQLYFLDKVMPGSPDSVKIGYTRQQIDWCKDNEKFIWQYFIQNNLLYNHDWQAIMHYIGPGPTTQGMPQGAPGDIGSWVGWQVVREYMSLHPEVTLSGLMEQKDAQGLLNGAKYRPR